MDVYKHSSILGVTHELLIANSKKVVFTYSYDKDKSAWRPLKTNSISDLNGFKLSANYCASVIQIDELYVAGFRSWERLDNKHKYFNFLNEDNGEISLLVRTSVTQLLDEPFFIGEDVGSDGLNDQLFLIKSYR